MFSNVQGKVYLYTLFWLLKGFAAAEKCDRGHVVWLDGVRQPLGDQVLIQLDNLYVPNTALVVSGFIKRNMLNV